MLPPACISKHRTALPAAVLLAALLLLGAGECSETEPPVGRAATTRPDSGNTGEADPEALMRLMDGFVERKAAELASDDLSVRRGAVRQLVGLSEWPVTHPLMVDGLLSSLAHETDRDSVQSVVLALESVLLAAADPRPIVDAMGARLRREADGSVQDQLLEALRRGGSASGPAADAVRTVYEQAEGYSRLPAGVVLTRITGGRDEACAETLRELTDIALSHPSIEARYAASSLLAEAGPPALDAALRLGEEADDEHLLLHALAFESIGAAGSRGVRRLASIARDNSALPGSRGMALWVLGQLDHDREQAAAELLDLWRTLRGQLRYSCAEALARIDSPPGEVRAWLAETAASPDPGVRRQAFRAVAAMSDPDPEAVELMLRELQDRGPAAMAAAESLGALQVPSPQVVLVLTQALSDADCDFGTRYAAGEALCTYGSLSAEGTSALAAMLDEGQPEELQDAAVKALSRLGPAAGAAAPALRSLLVRRATVGPFGLGATPELGEVARRFMSWEAMVGGIPASEEGIWLVRQAVADVERAEE